MSDLAEDSLSSLYSETFCSAPDCWERVFPCPAYYEWELGTRIPKFCERCTGNLEEIYSQMRYERYFKTWEI